MRGDVAQRQRGRAPVRWWQRRKALTEGLFGGSKPPPYAYWKTKINLFLGGHALGLTPPGIEIYTLATDFYGLIGAYPHIILLLPVDITNIYTPQDCKEANSALIDYEGVF